MKTIFNILFENNFRITVFMLLLMILGIECYLLHVTENCKQTIKVRLYLIITAISFVFGMIEVISSNSQWDNYIRYDVSLKPRNNSCLIRTFKDDKTIYKKTQDIFINTATYCHYFEDKDIIIFDDISSIDDVVYYLKEYGMKEKLTTETSNGINIDSDVINNIYENTNYLNADEMIMLIDKSWRNSKKIICTEVENQVYFMTEDLYKSAIQGDYEQYYLESKMLAYNGADYIGLIRGERDINQIILALVIFILGFGITCYSFNGEKLILTAFLSFPIGLFACGAGGLLLMILGIPMSRMNLLIEGLAIFSIELLLLYRKKILICIRDFLKISMIATALISFFSFTKIYSTIGDSSYKLLYGMYIAEYNLTRSQIISKCIPYGLLEPIVHCIAWEFKADWLYVMYPLIFVSTIGIIASTLYYLSDVENRKGMILLFLVSISMLLSNMDYLSISNRAMPNSIVGCAFLSIVSMILLLHREKYHFEILFSLITLAVSIIRVEGSIYISFFLIIACGLDWYRQYYANLNVISAIIILAWEFVLCLFSSLDNVFWSRTKAFACILAALIAVVVPWILKAQIKIITFIKKNYYKILTLGMGLVIIMILMFEEPLIGSLFSRDTLAVFLKHFATSENSNSAGLWGYVLLIFPLLLNNKKENAFLVSTIICYMFLIFLIFICRRGYPIHTSMADSCRRVITQIMPTLVLSISYIIGQKIDGNILLDN